jgi:hypothetical protein
MLDTNNAETALVSALMRRAARAAEAPVPRMPWRDYADAVSEAQDMRRLDECEWGYNPRAGLCR